MTNLRQKLNSLLAVLTAMFLSASVANAKGAGTSGGLTLVETNSARSSSMGEAFTAVGDDISAFGYNPATLGLLKTGQASFMYQQGLAEDSFGQFMVGSPVRNGSLGLSVGYYNGGDIELFDGTSERTVNAQRDLSVALGFARNIGGVSVGFTGKYLSSELIESAKATAYAADLGLSLPVSSRVRIGAAMQNFGTQLKFISEGDDLPRIARAGAAISLANNRNVTLLLDAPYYLNEAELRPSAGLEVAFGMLAVRGGFRKAGDSNELSIGTGFLIGKSSLDYSFGLANELDSRHRVSFSMRFGGMASEPVFVKKPVETPKVVKREIRELKKNQEREEVATAPVVEQREEEAAKEEITEAATVKVSKSRYALGDAVKGSARRSARRIYTVRADDSLETIALKVYGSKGQWKTIYSANKHLMTDPTDIEVGQKIVLP